MLLNTPWRSIQCRTHLRSVPGVAARTRRFTHFLHFFEVTETLRSRIKSVVGVVFEEINGLLAQQRLATDHAIGCNLVERGIVLKGEPESRLC